MGGITPVPVDVITGTVALPGVFPLRGSGPGGVLTALPGTDLAVLAGLGGLVVGIWRLWRWYRRYTSPHVVEVDDP